MNAEIWWVEQRALGITLGNTRLVTLEHGHRLSTCLFTHDHFMTVHTSLL